MNVWIYVSWIFIILAIIFQIKDRGNHKSNFSTSIVGLCCIPLTLVVSNKYKLIFFTLILICFTIDIVKFYKKKTIEMRKE
ncbi:MAG: hypothetical protein RR835_13440 [Peptostreptococcaceae bacterium]